MKPNLIKITTYNDLIQNPFSEGSTSHIAFQQVYHLKGAKKHPIDDLFYEFEKGEVLSLGSPAFQAWREQLAKMAGYPLLEKKPLKICGLQQIQKSYTVSCESGEEGNFSDLLCFGGVAVFIDKLLMEKHLVSKLTGFCRDVKLLRRPRT